VIEGIKNGTLKLCDRQEACFKVPISQPLFMDLIKTHWYV